MKENTFLAKSCPLERILDGSISGEELETMVSDFRNHLAQPHGTLENYHRRQLMEVLMRERPDIIDAEEVAALTAKKVNDVMARIYKLTLHNQKVNIYPQLLKMLLDYLRGREGAESAAMAVIVENNFIMDKEGQFTRPEEKIAETPS
jgi:hypothetical protein